MKKLLTLFVASAIALSSLAFAQDKMDHKMDKKPMMAKEHMMAKKHMMKKKMMKKMAKKEMMKKEMKKM